jgi:hypothetical protein
MFPHRAMSIVNSKKGIIGNGGKIMGNTICILIGFVWICNMVVISFSNRKGYGNKH